MFRQQLLYVLLASGLATALSLVANYFSILKTDNWYLSLIFFTVLNIALFVIYSFTSRSEDFTGILLGCLVGKLLISLLCLVLMRVFSTPPFLNLAIHFILHFAVYTSFEIRYVLWLIKVKDQ